jgi:hypothetical protein
MDRRAARGISVEAGFAFVGETARSFTRSPDLGSYTYRDDRAWNGSLVGVRPFGQPFT